MPQPSPPRSPLDLLGVLATQDVTVTPDLRQIEVYTLEGLLGLQWFGPADATDVVVALGGGMGGYLGPADGLYHRLGRHFAASGIATVCVDYRRPSRLEPSLLDAAAAADRAARAGAERFVFVGHSFGGAVAVQAAIALGASTAGVVGLATQSAGCEQAHLLGSTPLLLVHGDRDQILGPENSAMVRSLAGAGELEILPGADHLLTEAREAVTARLQEWIPEQLRRHESLCGA